MMEHNGQPLETTEANDYAILQMLGATWLAICLYKVAWDHGNGCNASPPCTSLGTPSTTVQNDGAYWCKDGADLFLRAQEAQEVAIDMLRMEHT